MKRLKRIWGWTEQNEAAWGIECRTEDIVPSEDFVTILPNGELNGSVIPEGQWYASFSQAKRACIDFWSHRAELARYVVRELRATAKGELTP